MEEHTEAPKIYRFGHNLVEILPYFLYEVTVYKITKNTVAIVNSQYYKSSKLLNIKKDTLIVRRNGHIIVTYLNVLGVTQEFLENNNLQLYLKKNERIH